jgi:uncharacterized protein involved in exopolysaccharide biosynthesis/Mrp family chromosome partitioning ATPase
MTNPSASLERPHYTRELGRLLSHHRRSVAWITAATIALSLATSLVWLWVSPSYQAVATLTTLPSKEELQHTVARGEFFGVHPAKVMSQTHTEFLLSRSLAESVVDGFLAADGQEDAAPRLRKNAFATRIANPLRRALGGALSWLNYGKVVPIDSRDALVHELRKNTVVENVPGSFVLKIEVVWDDPRLAALAANRICEAYARRIESDQGERLGKASQALAEKILEARVNLTDIDRRIEQFKSTTKVYSGSKDLELKMEELSGVMQDYNETQVRLEELETRLNLLKSYQTPLELAEIQAQRAGVLARKVALDSVIQEQVKNLEGFPAHETQWLILLRDKLDQEKIIDELRSRLLDLKLYESNDVSVVQNIDPAIPPPYPSNPKVLFNGVVGGVLGIVISFGYALGIHAVRADVRTPEILKRLGPALSGVLPYDPHHRAWDADIALPNPASPLASPAGMESVIGSHLEHLLLGVTQRGKGRVLMVSSSMPNVGKSYILKRLVEQSQRSGLKVLALDLDRREPSLHMAFGKKPAVSLADVAQGTADLEAALVQVNPLLDYAGSTGGESTYGSSLWKTERIREPLALLKSRYDLVLVDTAALRRDPMVTQLWEMADHILLVVDALETSIPEVEEFLQRSGKTRDKLSTVLNKVRFKGDYLFEA